MEKNRILIVIILSLFVSIGALGAPMTSERYNDFYRRKKELERENVAQEIGQKKMAESRKAEELEYERKASEYVKKRKAINQDQVDATAEKWMAEQDRLHEEAMDKARQKYISTQKDNNKFMIPESEEFDVK